MEGLIIIAVIWLVISSLAKGAKNASRSGTQTRRTGERPLQPVQAARPRPAARPGLPARPVAPADWTELMTVLSGEQARREQTQEAPSEEGVSTDSAGSFESLTGRTLMEGAATMMGDEEPDYEGRTLPGEAFAGTLATPPSEAPAEAPRPASRLRRDNAGLRDAVVWAEILAKPKSLRRVAR